jgi:2-polyprenyl-3-methyl-5-hydroxy-6-metoxy-1,4-benzoquinol methylase
MREKSLKNNAIKSFLKSYKEKAINLNSSKVWDTKFSEPEKIEDQDLMTREKISIIADCLKYKKQPIKLLDIGIGQAFLEQELSKRNIIFQLSTVDISKLSIQRAKRNYKAKGYKDDALNMDKYFKPKYFDVIVAIEVIEHISPNKIFSFYKKVHSLLREGGLFIISTPLNEGLRYMKDNPSAHVREYTQPILEAEFEISKFKIIKTKTLIAFKNLYSTKKYASKIFRDRWEPNNIIIVARKA